MERWQLDMRTLRLTSRQATSGVPYPVQTQLDSFSSLPNLLEGFWMATSSFHFEKKRSAEAETSWLLEDIRDLGTQVAALQDLGGCVLDEVYHKHRKGCRHVDLRYG
jgi:hypothetical protein